MPAKALSTISTSAQAHTTIRNGKHKFPLRQPCVKLSENTLLNETACAEPLNTLPVAPKVRLCKGKQNVHTL